MDFTNTVYLSRGGKEYAIAFDKYGIIDTVRRNDIPNSEFLNSRNRDVTFFVNHQAEIFAGIVPNGCK